MSLFQSIFSKQIKGNWEILKYSKWKEIEKIADCLVYCKKGHEELTLQNITSQDLS